MKTKEEFKSETREGEHEDERIRAVLFTAGVVLLLACLKRAPVVFLVEQWRAWVFLVLNLVLLAIFLTSTAQNQASNNTAKPNTEVKKKTEQTQIKKKKEQSAHLEASRKCDELGQKRSHECEREQEGLEDDSEPNKLSKEELNERVEAFIAMFRQHLALDARMGREKHFSRPKQAQMFNFQKRSSRMTLSTQEVKCFVF